MLRAVSHALLTASGIGESDCEALDDAFLAQPVNAVSSLAYVVVGLIVILIAARFRRSVAESVVFGLCLAAIGVGSVLFHGPQPAGSQILHDLPILITVLFVLAVDVALLWPRIRHHWIVFGAASVAATALNVVSAEAGAAATGVAVLAVVGLEVLIYRRRARDIPARRQLAIYGTILAVAAVAAATWLLGRTGSPVCDPDSDVQLHALWHLISASMFGLWWWLAFGVERSETAGDITA